MFSLPIRTKQCPEAVTCLTWSPVGRFIASGDAHQVRIWEVTKTKRARAFLPDLTLSPDSLVSTLAFSPDGTQLAIGSKSNRQVTIWEVATGLRRLTYDGHNTLLTLADSATRIWRIDWLPHGRHVASLAPELHVWDSQTGETCWSKSGQTGSFGCSPDGRLVLTSEAEWLLVRDSERAGLVPKYARVSERCMLRDARTGDELRRLPPEGYPGDWLPDGRHAIQKDGRSLSICDTNSRAVVRAWNPHYVVKQMGVSPDGALVATGGISWLGRYAVIVSLWETHTGRLIAEEEWRKPPAGELSLAWSPDGTQIAVGGLDKRVRVWKRPGNSNVSQQ